MHQNMFIMGIAVLMLFLLSTEAKPMEIVTTKADIEIGTDHLLLCKAGGEGDITWQKDGHELEEGVEKVDESSSQLIIKNAKMEDAGRYVCMCEFDHGHRDSVAYQIYVYEPLSFGSTEDYYEFLEGTTAVVPCKVTGKPEVDVQWIRDDVVVKRNGKRVSSLNDNSLQIKNIVRTDTGTHVCEGRIRGRKITKQLNVTIDVNYPPAVQIHEQVEKDPTGHEAVSLICLVEGHPKPNITWITPLTSDTSRFTFNSDHHFGSELILIPMEKSDYGEYVCLAQNKIGESSAGITLDYTEHPEVFLSQDVGEVEPGQSVSVECNVTGHPLPTMLWVSNTGHPLNSSEGRVRVEQGSSLVVEQVAPSDGGVYRCIALSIFGNVSRLFSLQTLPGSPSQVCAFPGPASVLFSLGGTQVDGGSPITHYVLQWRRSALKPWSEVVINARDPVAISSLKPYTSYSVRLAPKNHLGQGGFSIPSTVRTHSIRGEPDCPELSAGKARVTGSSFSIPFHQLEDGGTPITHYLLRYRPMKEGVEWKENRLPFNSTALQLRDLQFNTDYHLELMAINNNGSSIPAMLEFRTLQTLHVPEAIIMGTGIGIVMLIFLVLLLAVDITCCYTNHYGLLMFVAGRFFDLKTLEEVHDTKL